MRRTGCSLEPVPCEGLRRAKVADAVLVVNGQRARRFMGDMPRALGQVEKLPPAVGRFMVFVYAPAGFGQRAKGLDPKLGL